MSKPSHYIDDGKSAGRKRSPKQEQELARRGQTRRVARSGSGPDKGDVRKYNGMWRLEAKTTQARSFRVTMDMIEQIEQAALANREMPAIIVEFLDCNGKPLKEVAVVPSYVLDTLNEQGG